MTALSKTGLSKTGFYREGEIMRDADIITGTWELNNPTKNIPTAIPAKIAVIGDKSVVLIFKSIGAEIFPFTKMHKVREVIKELAGKEEDAIILLTENLAAQLEDFIKTFNDKPYPVILTIPSGGESLGLGVKKIQDNIAHVIGRRSL